MAAPNHSLLAERLTRGLEAPVVDVCRSLIFSLLSIPADQQRRLSFNRLAEFVSRDWHDRIFQSAVSALTTMPEHPLSLYYVIYDETEDREISVQRSEVRQAIAENVFIHPRTGEEVPCFADKLIPVFCVTSEFQDLANADNA